MATSTTRCCFCAGLSIEFLVSLAKEELRGRHTFPGQAFYQHQPSFDDLEASAKSGCDLCALILNCFKGAPTCDDDWTDWPEPWLGDDCAPEDSMYSLAKALEDSVVRVAISSDNLYLGEDHVSSASVNQTQTAATIARASQLDTLLIQVGPKLEESDEFYYRSWDLPALSLTLTVPTGHTLNVGGHTIGRSKLVPDLSASENFDIARGWLQTCREEHEKCPADHVPVLPTRVVDVGVAPDFQDLRIMFSDGASGRYVALSHCWGGRIATLLTKDTMESYAHSLSYSDLPANFRDAIIITRNMGIRYLWIDSLCIIQDSKQDWEAESVKMGDVYRNSAFTISALSSPSSTSGIFRNKIRPIPNLEPITCNFLIDSKPYQIEVSRYDDSSEKLNSLTRTFPLNSRGWCLQESILSPCHLMYGHEQIYWRCPLGFRDAEGCGPVPGRRSPAEEYREAIFAVLYAEILRAPAPRPRTEHNVENLLTEYYSLVQEYTGRKLTFGSDKLPAFSGIAQRLHPVIGGDYLAGLWSKDLHRGLCWRGGCGPVQHAQPSRAPSWSWAVTDDEVWAGYVVAKDFKSVRPDNPLSLQLIDHDMDRKQPYGQITSGSLVVRGLTKTMTRSTQVVDAISSRFSLGTVEFDKANDNDKDNKEEVGLATLLFPTVHGNIVSVVATHGDNEDWELEIAAFCREEYTMLLVHAEADGEGEWIEDRASCLVLRQLDVEGDDTCTYRRVGVVTLNALKLAWLRKWETSTVILV